jgi:murein DD-endopeptidase MepM/ murein hydrolase activator NlpD
LIKKLYSSSAFKKISIAILAIGLVVVSFFLLDNYTVLFTKSGDYAVEADSARIELEVVKPIVLYGIVVNDLHVIEDHVKRNQRFFELFDSVHVLPQVKRQLQTLSKKIFDFRKVGAHKKYTLIHEHDSLKTARALVYEPNSIDYIIFHLKDSLSVELCQREVVTVEKTISGRIESSLSETIEQLNISNELTNKFVDIFGWQVDFQRLQKGDQFKLIYEENLVEEKPISIGKILGIYFEHFDQGYYAFPFDQGDGADYFDDKGNSLRKALLKYPIEFTRISSRYSMSRFHPVVKVFRPHLGTDFAAPTGTPIRSVGDGTVQEAQYSANNGNYVKIHHNGTYTTGYLHMSKIASGVVAGTRVKQGQTIGFVGSTGLATGPHLCYRFWRNGVQIDALRVELPPSQPVKKEQLQNFDQVKDSLIKRLQLIPFPPPSSGEVIVAGN